MADSNLTIQDFDIRAITEETNEIPPKGDNQKLCKYTFARGERKGQKCGKKVMDRIDYCIAHNEVIERRVTPVSNITSCTDLSHNAVKEIIGLPKLTGGIASAPVISLPRLKNTIAEKAKTSVENSRGSYLQIFESGVLKDGHVVM